MATTVTHVQRQGYTSVRHPAWMGETPEGKNLLPGGILLKTSSFTNPDATVVTLTADAAVAATSLTVTALDGSIPNGTVLTFGTEAAVTVTLTAAASASATSLTVSALTGALPSGTILHFGTTKFAKLSAAAAVGATTLTVLAIPVALSSSDSATVAAEDPIAAVTTADADVGDTTIAVKSLTYALATGSVARYVPPLFYDQQAGVEIKRVPSGTLVYATQSDFEGHQDTGVEFSYVPTGTALSGTPVIYLIPFDVLNLNVSNESAAVRAGTLVYTNLIPNWSAFDSTVQALVRAKYECSIAGSGVEVA